MKRKIYLFMAVIMSLSTILFTGCNKTPETLKEAYEDYFPIGAAMSASMITLDTYTDGLINHFNSMTAENEMKWMALQPRKGEYMFNEADKMVNYAKEQEMMIRGHALVWHSSMPDYLKNEKNEQAMLDLVEDHVKTVVTHFGDDIYAWDVVNEVITDGSGTYRESELYKVTGTKYIERAFTAAHEANPNIKLYYNDYEMINPVKRGKTIEMIKMLQQKGVPIHGVGMQAHYNIHNFNFVEFEKAIVEFSELGIDVQITELDFSVYPSDNTPEYGFLSPELEKLQAHCYKRLFEIMRKHSDKITGVTFWGVADDYTWLDDFPVKNRKNYPFLFDIFHQPKLSYEAVLIFED